MKALERTTILVFIITLLVFSAVTVHLRFFVDRTPPVLQCSTDLVEVSVNDPESALLFGVTAQDDRDGDLTSQVMVQSVTPLITSNTAVVTYTVFDSSNNMATCTRTVRYADYSKPTFSLSRPLIFRVGQTVTLKDRLTAFDTLDGDLSGRIRITTQNILTQHPGVYSITVQVTNSAGDVSALPLKVIITEQSTDQRILLNQYICYVKQGESFDPAAHITMARNADYSYAENTDVTIHSNVDTQVPGVYDVLYSHDGYSVYLTVVVE